MMWYIAALVAILAGTRAQQDINKKQEQPAQPVQQPAPLTYYGGFQGQQLPLQYDLRFLEPHQVQIQNLGFSAEKQIFPNRVQPQVLFYAGGAPPGQQFLLQPGAPPGNFLIPQPQPGPEIVLRDPQPRPLFIAGYPKPAHVPPIEKDAEEIPTDPAKIPKFPSKKPEKLETFNESDKEDGGEQEIPSSVDKNNLLPKKSIGNLKPGTRFFVLNGQNLFPNYPFHTFNGGIPQGGIEPLKYEQAAPQQQEYLLHQQQPQQQQQQQQQQQIPGFEQYLQTQQQYPFLLGSPINYAHNELNSQLPSQNVVSLNQPQDFKTFAPQESYPAFPYAPQQFEARENEKNPEAGPNENYNSEYLVGGSISKVPLKYYQYETTRLGPESDESVVIDAKSQDEKKSSSLKASPSPTTPTEPSISQAQPGAIALAGPGGVAAAAPRGTALVGEGGLAVSSPQATAVAGPTKEEQPQKKNKNRKP